MINENEVDNCELGEFIDEIDPPYVRVYAVTLFMKDGRKLEGSAQCVNQGGFWEALIDTFEED